MALGYKNENPYGDIEAKEILSLGLDLVTNVSRQVEDEGEDMIILLCNLKDKLGKSIAYINNPEAHQGNDLWVYAISKKEYAQLMMDHGLNEDAARMKPGKRQVVVFTAGISHYFQLEGRYSGVPKGSHWAEFRKKDFTG